MGTYRHSDDMLITIPLDKEQAAYEALIEYSINNRRTYRGQNLQEMLEEEGFQVDRYEIHSGNCLELRYMQEGKHYNLTEIFTVLAPFIRTESYCTVIVENGTQSQYQFFDGTVVEKQAKIIFE